MEYLFQVFYPSKEEGRNIHIEHGAVNKYKLLIPKQRKQFAVGDNISVISIRFQTRSHCRADLRFLMNSGGFSFYCDIVSYVIIIQPT